MKFLITLAFAMLAATAVTAAPAQAAESKGYDVICVTPILPGGQPGPEVCVPIPI